MRWSSKSLGSRLQHEFFYFLVRMRLVWLARFSLAFVVLYYSIRPDVRHRIYPYLSRRFPQDRGLRRWLHCLRLYWTFAQGLLDRAICGILGPRSCGIVPITDARFHSAVPAGQGCLVLTAHIGAWQIALNGLEALQRPINIAQWLDPQDADKHYFQQNHREGGPDIRLINTRADPDAALKIATVLRHGELVCLTGDRITSPAEPAMEVTFLGDTVRLPATPWLLASLAQVPLVISFAIRHTRAGVGTVVEGIVVERVNVPPHLRRNPEVLHRFVQQFAARMEDMVMRYPYHFFNFFDMWSCDDSTGMPPEAQGKHCRHPQP